MPNKYESFVELCVSEKKNVDQNSFVGKLSIFLLKLLIIHQFLRELFRVVSLHVHLILIFR